MSRSSEVILYNQPYIPMLFIRYSKNYYVFGIFAHFFHFIRTIPKPEDEDLTLKFSYL